jgi:cyanophycinase
MKGIKMAGYLLLEGGAEFEGSMAEADRRALQLAGGPEARISILPTAAAPDNNHQRAGNNGLRWFRSLGARQVDALPLIDAQSAEGPEIVEALRRSQLIYLLGGFPRFLGDTLMGSASGRAILDAYQAGAVVAGSSAGAMVLCQHYYDPASGQVVDGLNMLPRACVLPHHNKYGQSWANHLAEALPEVVLIGIDEGTGMLDDSPDGGWTVYGQGQVTLYREAQVSTFGHGEVLHLKVTPDSTMRQEEAMMGQNRKLYLIHWNAEEAGQLAEELRAQGWEVQSVHDAEQMEMTSLRQSPPQAVVISLRRLPSHGREVANALWHSKWGRKIPIVFVDGAEDKVALTRQKFPSGRFASWEELPTLLEQL